MTKAKNINVLFTSVGRRVELLRCFRESYRRLGITGNIVALDIDPLAPALRVADMSYLVPRLDSPEYLPVLLDIVEQEQITVILPLIDPDIPWLASHREQLESAGARLAVVDREAADIVSDKWQTTRFFERLGLTVPRSWLPGEFDASELTFPLFIKPRCGSASQYVFKVDSPHQLDFFSDYVPDPIVQEFLSGPEITNDVVCDLDGDVLAVVSRQRIRTQGGEVTIGKTIFDQTITDACVRVAQSLPAIGPITVQCMMNEGEPVFTEINARFGGGVPLGIAAGADSPTWFMERVMGSRCDIPPIGTYKRDFYLSRYHESNFVDGVELEKQCDVLRTVVPKPSMA